MRDRLLDDRAWLAAQRTLATGEDVEVDLSPRKRQNPGRSGLSVRGHVRLLTEDDRRFAVVYVDDQSEHARMEATRRDFVANVSHELKTPVGAMGVLAEALLASADDPETVRRFAEKMVAESNRLANMVGELIELSRLQGAERAARPRGRRRRHRGRRGAVAVQGGRRQRRHRHHHRRADRLPGARRPAAAGDRDRQPGVQRNRLLAQRIFGVDQPQAPGRQHRDRRHRSGYRHRRAPTRSGCSSGSSASTRPDHGPPAAPGSAWRSSSTSPPITTDPSGCGVSRERDRRSPCRFRPTPTTEDESDERED